jgi:FkbM family methyltransferase
MQLLHFLPKPFLRHKVIDFLCKSGFVKNVSEISFNDGSKAIVDLLDPEPRNVFISGEFETHFFKIAEALLDEDGIFFDLGGNVGLCSFGLVTSKPKAHYHIFEANPHMISLMEKSKDLQSQHFIELNQACVSNEHGKTTFCIEQKQSGQSHVATDDESGIEVMNLVLDNYCSEKRLEKIDFAKIDLEGHEMNALKGWKRYLTNHAVQSIYIEIIPENQNRYGLKTNDPLNLLESLGYELFLCKEDDFANFDKTPMKYKFKSGKLILAKFQAREFPESFATDVLALAPGNLKH